MTGLEAFQKALSYVETKMQEEIEMEEVAKIACCSKFHFQRLFHVVTGLTLGEYIRNRRLALAANDLLMTDEKIIEIAFKYGYQTPEGFSKSFKRQFGYSPTKVRSQKPYLNMQPKLTFQLQIKGVEEMKVKIVEKESFTVVGPVKKVTVKDGENFKIIPKFWNEVMDNGEYATLMEHMGPMGVLGVCADMNMDEGVFDYGIMIEKNNFSKDGWEEKTIPASTYAVFEATGPLPESLQKVIQRIYSEWFPSVDFEHAGTTELEVYMPGDPSSPEYKSEYWVPVKGNAHT
jgi:AraC family transcriptional regulator